MNAFVAFFGVLEIGMLEESPMERGKPGWANKWGCPWAGEADTAVGYKQRQDPRTAF